MCHYRRGQTSFGLHLGLTCWCNLLGWRPRRRLPWTQFAANSTVSHCCNVRKESRWLKSSLSDAPTKGEQWYPMKLDTAVKLCARFQIVDDVETLNKDFANDSKAGKCCWAGGCTAMKALRPSKVDANKRGMVYGGLAEEQSRCRLCATNRQGYGRRERRFLLTSSFGDNSSPCYRCNRYRRKQASYTSQIRRAICSKRHCQGEGTKKDSLRCPACSATHTVFD